VESGSTLVFMVVMWGHPALSLSFFLFLYISYKFVSFLSFLYPFLALSFFRQGKADIIINFFFFLTKMAFGVCGTCGEILTILPHTWTFV
jgi:hypothetical protein